MCPLKHGGVAADNPTVATLAVRRRTAPLAACVGLTAALLSASLAVPPAIAALPVPPAQQISRSVTTFRPDKDDAGRAVVVQTDGKVLVAGIAGGDFGLARYTVGGTGDAFADDGMATTDFGGADGANTATVDASGGTVAAGWTGGDVAVARYDALGHLDRAFGNEGRVATDLGGTDDAAYAVASQPGGRIVVAGGNASAMVLLRYGRDGALDPGFGAGGRAAIPSDGPGRAVAVLPDGSFVVAGGGPAGFHVARVTAAGALDSAFGAGGTTRVSLGAPAMATGLAVLPDGRMSVAGSRGGDIALVRLLPTGAMDPSFGLLGVVGTDLGGVERPHALALAPDGRQAVVGEGGPMAGFIVSYRPDGSLDTAFRTTGWVLTDDMPLWAVTPASGGNWFSAGTRDGDAALRKWLPNGGYNTIWDIETDWSDIEEPAQGAVRQPDGRTVVVARTGGSIGLVRYRTDGSMDPTFGNAGRVVSDLASGPTSLVLQRNGRIVVAGRHENQIALVAFRPDGSLDRTWGADAGRTITDIGDVNQWPWALDGLDADAILFVGTDGSRSVIARYSAEGRLDTTFGTGGMVLGSFNGIASSSGKHILRQPDGKRIVYDGDPTVHRFNSDGTADRSFGEGGTLTVDFTSSGISAAALLPDGKLLLGGRSGYTGFAIARFNADGSRDRTWRVVLTTLVESGPLWQLASLVVLPDGRILATSVSVVARYLSSGAPDRTFGNEGTLGIRGAPHSSAAFSTISDAWVESDGVLAAVGTDTGWGEGAGVIFARFAVPRAGSSTLRAWGWNPVGELGTGDTIDRRTAADVAGLTGIVDMSAGVYHNLALRADGTVWAWGWNGVGQLGDGTTADRHRPVQVTGLTDVVEISAGLHHSLALKRDYTVWAWGWNGFGQLGDGSTTDRHSPVRVVGLDGATGIAAGGLHSLARVSVGVPDSTVWAWGWNGFGQLGDGTTADRALPVQAMTPARAGARAVGAGTYHSMLLYDGGTGAAWGWNAVGQLGDGTTVDRHVPTLIRSQSGFLSVSGGGLHSLGHKADGTVWAWGWNGVGQLGDGTTIDRHQPVQIRGLAGMATARAGLYHSVAAGSNGAVSGWGWNAVGQLGDGTTVDRHSPVAVGAVPPAAAVAAGAFHTLAH